MFNFNLSKAIGRFRLIAFIEGLSYIFLLFIVIPLKYVFNLPGTVKYTGSINGFIFLVLPNGTYTKCNSFAMEFTKNWWHFYGVYPALWNFCFRC